jgi:hypothetical protein
MPWLAHVIHSASLPILPNAAPAADAGAVYHWHDACVQDTEVHSRIVGYGGSALLVAGRQSAARCDVAMLAHRWPAPALLCAGLQVAAGHTITATPQQM